MARRGVGSGGGQSSMSSVAWGGVVAGPSVCDRLDHADPERTKALEPSPERAAPSAR